MGGSNLRISRDSSRSLKEVRQLMVPLHSNQEPPIRQRSVPEVPSASSDCNERDDLSHSVKFSDQLCAARDGNREALGDLLQSLQPHLLRVAALGLQAGGLSEQSPSDHVQSAFLKGVQSFPSFRGSTRAEFRAWLRQILINNLRDSWRNKQRAHTVRDLEPNMRQSPNLLPEELPSADEAPSHIAMENELRALVQEVLDGLPDRPRQVVLLRGFRNMTFEEIGKQMGCSGDAVRHQWLRGLTQLGKSLRPVL